LLLRLASNPPRQAQGEAMETAMRMALRTHEDQVDLFARLAEHARTRGHERAAAICGKTG
jgi:hypothetical protein